MKPYCAYKHEKHHYLSLPGPLCIEHAHWACNNQTTYGNGLTCLGEVSEKNEAYLCRECHTILIWSPVTGACKAGMDSEISPHESSAVESCKPFWRIQSILEFSGEMYKQLIFQPVSHFHILLILQILCLFIIYNINSLFWNFDFANVSPDTYF